MRWTMPNVTVAAALVLLLATAETVFAVGGGGGGGSGGGGGGGRQRGAATATAADRQLGAVASGDGSSQKPTGAAGAEPRQSDATVDEDDRSPQTPAAVQCSSCLAHESIRTLSLELIKLSILNKLGMQRPPEFGGRRPPKVPTDLPPLQDLMRKYNSNSNNYRDSPMVVMPHIRHKSHHYESSGDGGVGGGYGSDMQSDEAASYAAAAVSIMDTANNGGSSGGGGGDDEDDDYHVKTHKLMAFAQPHPMMPKFKNHHLLYFTFSEQTGQHRITEAILWLYKRRTDLIVEDAVIKIDVYRIHQGSPPHQAFVSSIKRIINTTEPGWVPIDLQRRMSDWFKTTNGAKNLTLMVDAHYTVKNLTHSRVPFVTDARKRDDMTEIPYLEVHTEDGRRSRSKRSGVLGMDCDENSNEPLCCRYPLTVDFEEFGWDWIIAPKKYEANYCSGECPLEFLQKYPHTHLAQLTNKTGGYPGTGPCCAPRKLSAISMLYFDEDSNIIYGLLPGMVVNKCGCS